MSKVILIRADGSKETGMGHLNRSCLVADYLVEKHNIECVFITKTNVSANSFLAKKKSNHKIIWLDNKIKPDAELECIKNEVKNNKVSLILLDLLESHLTDKYLDSLHLENIPLAVITDDSNYREIDADLILNGNPNQCEFDYSKCRGNYLLGPSFFIMDAEYGAHETRNLTTRNRMLITLGGSDHNDLLFTVLDVLMSIEAINELVVVSSESTGYLENLKEYIKNQRKNIKLYYDVKSIAPLWSECDLAITAGGNTLFERIASGTPGATICQLPRQMEIANKFSELGVNKNIGYGPELKHEELAQIINEFIKDNDNLLNQISNAKKVVGGDGLLFFTNELCKLIKE